MQRGLQRETSWEHVTENENVWSSVCISGEGERENTREISNSDLWNNFIICWKESPWHKILQFPYLLTTPALFSLHCSERVSRTRRFWKAVGGGIVLYTTSRAPNHSQNLGERRAKQFWFCSCFEKHSSPKYESNIASAVPNTGKDTDLQDLLYTAGGSMYWLMQPLCKNTQTLPFKGKLSHTLWQAFLLPGLYPREVMQGHWEDMYKNVHSHSVHNRKRLEIAYRINNNIFTQRNII